jgi:hypothetical protein
MTMGAWKGYLSLRMISKLNFSMGTEAEIAAFETSSCTRVVICFGTYGDEGAEHCVIAGELEGVRQTPQQRHFFIDSVCLAEV